MLRIPSELLLALSEDAGALAAVSTTCTSRDSVGYNALQLVWPMLEANKHSGIAVGHADTPTADWHAEAGRVDRAFLERLLELAAGGPGDDDEACCQTDEAAVAASESELHLLMELLPHARHCLLPALAHHGGNVPLVSAALGSSVATARGAALPLGPGLHYVRTSAFLAAAAGAFSSARACGRTAASPSVSCCCWHVHQTPSSVFQTCPTAHRWPHRRTAAATGCRGAHLGMPCTRLQPATCSAGAGQPTWTCASNGAGWPACQHARHGAAGGRCRERQRSSYTLGPCCVAGTVQRCHAIYTRPHLPAARRAQVGARSCCTLLLLLLLHTAVAWHNTPSPHQAFTPAQTPDRT